MDDFSDFGPSEDAAHRGGIQIPEFLEVEGPDSFKPIEECSRSEIEASILSLTMQAEALIDRAKALGLYLDERGDDGR
jgi:hypothetical protein